VFWGDLYGCGGDNPQPPVAQLADIIRARKLFGYGETRDVWDHPNCVGLVKVAQKHILVDSSLGTLDGFVPVTRTTMDVQL